jgi:hypothetical protein
MKKNATNPKSKGGAKYPPTKKKTAEKKKATHSKKKIAPNPTTQKADSLKMDAEGKKIPEKEIKKRHDNFIKAFKKTFDFASNFKKPVVMGGGTRYSETGELLFFVEIGEKS